MYNRIYHTKLYYRFHLLLVIEYYKNVHKRLNSHISLTVCAIYAKLNVPFNLNILTEKIYTYCHIML